MVHCTACIYYQGCHTLLPAIARVSSFEQIFWAAFFTRKLLRLLQLAETFVARCVDSSVFSGTYFCCATLTSFLETNWKWLGFPISPRVKRFFLPFGGWFSFLLSLWHLEHLSTLGQEQSIKSPRHRQKQQRSMELILAAAGYGLLPEKRCLKEPTSTGKVNKP